MRPIIAVARDGGMEMGELSKALLHDWIRANPGRKIRIECQEPPSYSMRKFFEGAVVQYFFYQHNRGAFRDFRDSRESLKLEFNPTWIINAAGRRQMIGGSTAGKSKDWWVAFLDRIQDYFMQSGYEFPDSEEYKKWVRSAPLVDEIFPPLRRLIALYKRK